jgi:putative peptide zinc metalloprotease protein
MLVDGGGMYASLWMASFAAGLYLATHSSVFGVLAMLYDLTVLMNLNPFIRMDAYWLFSDAIDVPNLMAENRSLTSWLLLRLLGIRRRSPRILSLDTKLKGVYLGYYVLFLAFTVLAGLRFLAWYPHLLASLQRSVQGVATAAHEGGLSAETLRWALRLALSLAPIVGLSAYLLGLTSRLMRRARKSLANMANSRKQECAIRDDRVSAVPNGPPTL